MGGGQSSGRPEFSLALECCKWGFRGPREPAGELSEPIDWPRFSNLVGFHRIEGLASAFLAENNINAPPDLLTRLSRSAAQIAARNLAAAADCQKLVEAFEAANVPLLFIKGLTTGALAYRNPALKSAIDIDLLTDRADLRKAAAVLRECGYHLSAPRDSDTDTHLSAWHHGWKESVWAKPEPPLQVDLHTRLTDNARLLPTTNVHSPRQWVDIGNGIRLPTLADEECFAYTAVHGAWSAWFRLKWISDFAGLLHGRSGNEIEHLYRQSLKLGGGRSAGQGLLLADTLFGTLKTAPGLRQRLLKEPTTRRLCRAALRLLTREPKEPTATPLGSLPIRRLQFFLLPGLDFKLLELWGQTYRAIHRPPA